MQSTANSPDSPSPRTEPAPGGLRWRRGVALVAGLLVAGGLAWLLCLRFSTPTRARLEAAFQRAGKHLLPIPAAIPAGRAGWSVRFDLASLATHALYLSPPGATPGYVYVDPEGRVRQPGRPELRLASAGEVLITPAGATLFLDGLAQDTDLGGWTAQWATALPAPPARATHVIPQVSVADDFMRKSLEDYADCRVRAGRVTLAQHGGGMASSSYQEADADFERAVNPFSVFAREYGTVSYTVPGAEYGGDVAAEARFYFGVPKTGNVVDINTLPVDTDMLLVQGPLDGEQVAFGWCGAARAFRLMTRRGQDRWTLLATWDERRPPLTNWVRIGLALRRGHLVEGRLDDAPVLRAVLPGRVKGPFHIVTGQGLAEFDDVRAWSLPAVTGTGSPLRVKSRNFAGKHAKDSSDPPQFREWANSTGAFVRSRSVDGPSRTAVAAITTAMPLMGDFFYTAVAQSDTSGDVPIGAYSFRLLLPRPGDLGTTPEPEPLFSFQAERTASGWVVPELHLPDGAGAEAATALPELALARARETDGRLALRVKGQWLPLSPPIPGPVQFSVRRSQSGERLLFSPTPDHHVLSCRNLVHEFFEQAPTDWSWLDGAFRMDCRWACQDQWSFMACGSPALPYMASKRTFGGDQVHEYFICLRATFPWDAGDSRFAYDPQVDRANGFPEIQAHHGWYNRHDLNFAFCTDGVNPLSGYAIVFGGDDNRETRLLRQGAVVARTQEWRFLFPTDPEHTAVHWNWWKFTVHKFGGLILVRLNDTELFRFADPEPLAGGHIGFWSLRNGFALSRLSSVAERIDWQPQALYVTPSVDGPWVPLRRDTVALSPDPEAPGLTRVTNRSGGGFFAVRWTPPTAVDLQATPVLELPLRLGPGATANLHLAIGGSAFLLRLGDTPLGATKALLTPDSEKGECFQLPDLPLTVLEQRLGLGTTLPEDGIVRVDLGARLQALGRPPTAVVLSSLTLGNTSNAGYLLAGRGGNPAGAWYAVGVPRFRPARPGTAP
jgi:hypothetical protein